MAQRHAHAVAGDDAAVGVVAVDAACAAGSHHYRIGADLHQRAFHHVHRHQATGLTVIDQNVEDEVLVKALNLWELKGGLEQGMQHVEAGFIGGKPGAFNLHTAEAANVDATVWPTAPRTAPLFELGHFGWAMMDEVIDDILLAKPVAAGDGVVKMVFEAIMVLCDGGGATFCGHRVAAHRINF